MGCRCTIFIPTSNQSQLLPPVHTNPPKHITHHQLNPRTLHRHTITPTSSPLSTPRAYSEKQTLPGSSPNCGSAQPPHDFGSSTVSRAYDKLPTSPALHYPTFPPSPRKSITLQFSDKRPDSVETERNDTINPRGPAKEK